MNVLDLSVFPNMLRSHFQLARKLGGLKVLLENEIRAAAKRVWEDLESAKIALGFSIPSTG
jgi:transposase